MKRLVMIFVIALVATFGAKPVFAATEDSSNSASTVIVDAVEQVKKAVKEGQDSMSEAALDEKLRKIIVPVFDFREMSRRSLARNWKEATKEQQVEFVDLFSNLLSKNYLKKIRENAVDGRFELVGEQGAGADRSVVRTIVGVDGKTAAIDYRLRAKDNSWKVYDVIIENIGLVSNYRSEFSGIVSKSGVEGLLEKLRAKNE